MRLLCISTPAFTYDCGKIVQLYLYMRNLCRTRHISFRCSDAVPLCLMAPMCLSNWQKPWDATAQLSSALSRWAQRFPDQTRMLGSRALLPCEWSLCVFSMSRSAAMSCGSAIGESFNACRRCMNESKVCEGKGEINAHRELICWHVSRTLALFRGLSPKNRVAWWNTGKHFEFHKSPD